MQIHDAILWTPGFLAVYTIASIIVVLVGVGIAVLLMRSDV